MNYSEQYLMRFDDVCANKHNFNGQSIEANKKVNKENDRNFILSYITKNGTAYSKELARVMNKGLNCISGRISELKSDGLIRDTEVRKEGCAIYEINPIKQQPIGETKNDR